MLTVTYGLNPTRVGGRGSVADLYGITFAEPPDEWTALEGLAVIKALNEEGELSMFVRLSQGLWDFEALGMLTAVCDDLRRYLVKDIEPDDAPPDEDDEPTDG
jgi:hypothetical protein